MQIDELIQRARSAIDEAHDLGKLDSVRVEFLGKKGQLTDLLKSLGTLPADSRKAAGQSINEGKRQLQKAIEERRGALEESLLEARLGGEAIDVTLPGRCLLYTSPSPRDATLSRMPSSA